MTRETEREKESNQRQIERQTHTEKHKAKHTGRPEIHNQFLSVQYPLPKVSIIKKIICFLDTLGENKIISSSLLSLKSELIQLKTEQLTY